MVVFMTWHLKKNTADELASPVTVQGVSCSLCLACVFPDMPSGGPQDKIVRFHNSETSRKHKTLCFRSAGSLESTRDASFLEVVSLYRGRPKIYFSFGRLRYSCILNRFLNTIKIIKRRVFEPCLSMLYFHNMLMCLMVQNFRLVLCNLN